MSVTVKCLSGAQLANSSATTIYTVPAATTTIIDKFTVTNTDASTRTVSVYLVASGGAPGTVNLIIDALSITTLQTIDVTALQNQILGTGDSISVFGSVASVLVTRASGREIT